MKNAPVPRLLPRGNVLLFLLLLVVALGWMNDVDASPNPNCTEGTIVLKEGELWVIANVTKRDYYYLDKTVYLRPEEGFRGIGLQTVVGTASGGNKSVDAWFSNSLLPAVNTSSWWQLAVTVTRTKDNVTFSVHLVDDPKECVFWVANDNIQSVEMGYSPSRWRDTEPPPGCPYQGLKNSPFRRQDPPTCTELPTIPSTTPTPSPEPTPTPPPEPTPTPPPEPTPTPPPEPAPTPPPEPTPTPPPEPTQTWVIVVVVLVVLVVVGVPAVVVVVMRRRKHTFTALSTR